jgi:hypothetical protein
VLCANTTFFCFQMLSLFAFCCAKSLMSGAIGETFRGFPLSTTTFRFHRAVVSSSASHSQNIDTNFDKY